MNVNPQAESPTCIVVGAGMAGLLAAQGLRSQGMSVLVLEGSSRIGGRMAGWASGGEESDGPIIGDAGAQFFTVRDARFERLVTTWRSLGLVQEWSRGFATADGSYYADGFPRYRAVPHMEALPRYLARELDVRPGIRVTSVSRRAGTWELMAQGERHLAPSLILTPPVPQALALLRAGNVALADDVRATLEKISYEPCIAALILLDGLGGVPEPGGLWPVGGPLTWIADNHRKGVSAAPGAITIHAAPEFSQAYWDEDDRTIIPKLLAAAAPWLGDEVRSVRLRRWRYSKPNWTHPEPCLGVQQPGEIVFAGDAFAGPRVEGAAISGMAAADLLLRWRQGQGR